MENIYLQRKSVWRWSLLPLSFLVLMCVGCSEPQDVNKLISNANEHISDKNYSAAVISLKNAIQIEERNQNLREMLAEVYSAIGNYPAAEQYRSRVANLVPWYMPRLDSLVRGAK